jgi:Zn-dependent protease with chaperone function
MTGDPAALASALETLDAVDRRPTTDLRAAALLNLLPEREGSWITRYGHPPTRKRIERLRAMVEG